MISSISKAQLPAEGSADMEKIIYFPAFTEKEGNHNEKRKVK